MYEINTEVSFIIQGLLAVIVLGTLYNLTVITRAYGGIIGKAMHLIGTGMLFFTISLIERSLVIFGIIETTYNTTIIQDVLQVLALICLGFGFSRLASASKGS